MKTTLALLAALIVTTGWTRAETPDPMPVALDPMPVTIGESEDGRYFAGVFDFVRPKRATCLDGNCANSSASSSPVTVSAPTQSTTTFTTSIPRPAFTPIRTFASRFRARFGGLWFPGKILLSSARGDCGCGNCP